MNNEYIIINKTKVLSKIEEIHNERKKLNTGNLPSQEARGQLQAVLNILGEVLSQSTPLIPEIEKAFDAGSDYGEDCANSSMGVGEDYPNKQNYISNLKLDI